MASIVMRELLLGSISTSSDPTARLAFMAEPSKWGPKMFNKYTDIYEGRIDVRLLRPGNKQQHNVNPYVKQNFGLVDVRTRGDDTHVRFRLLGYDNDSEAVEEAFMTGWL